MDRPSWGGAFEGYASSYIRAQAWRVAGRYEFDDLYQEAVVVFLKCIDRYPRAEPAHFMSLFKTALARRITDLARESMRKGMQTIPDDAAAESPSAMFALDLANAPEVVQRIAENVRSMPEESWAPRRWGRRRERTGHRLARLAGVPKYLGFAVRRDVDAWLQTIS